MGKLRVVISGGSGFLGREIRKSLTFLNVEVCLLIRECSATKIKLSPNESTIEVKWPEGLSKIEFASFDYFIYLSHSPVSERMSYAEVERINLLPLTLLLNRLTKSNTPPHLIFVSSQAAISKNRSNYGRLKSDSEIQIKDSGISATVVRPGLIIGKGQSGLFNSMIKFIRVSPVVPVIGKKSDQIQVVFIEDFIKVLMLTSGLATSKRANGFRIIEVADKPIDFELLLKKIAKVQGLKRFFIRVPNFIILKCFWLLENVLQYRKITSSSFLGFLNLELLDHQKIWNELGIQPLEIDEAIKRSVIEPEN